VTWSHSFTQGNCMKNKIYKFVVTGFILAVISSRIYGQEYFNTIATPQQLQPVAPASAETPADQIPADRVDISNPGISTPGLPAETNGSDKYNMALGPVHFGIAAGVGLEYNDNINLAPDGQRISDFAVIPSLTVDSTYQLSELNTLRFSLGASYTKYFDHSEFDTRGVLLSPNSVLEFTMHVSNIAITFRDRFSYQEDPFDLPVQTGVGVATTEQNSVYRHFENQVGVQADWAINENFKVTAGYDHYNLWTDEEFKSLEHSVDTIFIKPSFVVTPAITAGVDASVSFVSFTENIQNGGTSYMAGPFAQIALTQNTHLYVEGGFSSFDFNHDGTINDTSNSNTWYGRLDLSNQLSEAFSQRLSFTKSTEVGFGSNFYDLYHVEYAADWKIMENLTLDPSIFYEHYKTSAPVGTQSDTGDRYGASVGLRYILTPSITLGLDYRYLYNSSNLGSLLDYRQNLVLLSAYYNF